MFQCRGRARHFHRWDTLPTATPYLMNVQDGACLGNSDINPHLSSVRPRLGPSPRCESPSLSLSLFVIMAARVLKIDELATRIAANLRAISPKDTVSLALTCRALEVPALRALWETRLCSFGDLFMHMLPTDAWCFVFPDPDEDFCLLVSLFARPVGMTCLSILSIPKIPTVVEPTAHYSGAE